MLAAPSKKRIHLLPVSFSEFGSLQNSFRLCEIFALLFAPETTQGVRGKEGVLLAVGPSPTLGRLPLPISPRSLSPILAATFMPPRVARDLFLLFTLGC